MRGPVVHRRRGAEHETVARLCRSVLQSISAHSVLRRGVRGSLTSLPSSIVQLGVERLLSGAGAVRRYYVGRHGSLVWCAQTQSETFFTSEVARETQTQRQNKTRGERA